VSEETTAILEQIGTMQRNLAELKASLTDSWNKENIPREPFEIFVCRARNERYGLPVELVKEVLPMCGLTAYPQGPCWFAGILNLRGEMIPVVDVASRIERRQHQVEVTDFIVVVDMGKKRFGLVFQEVFQVETVEGRAVQPTISDIPEALYVLGIVETEKHPVFLLSLACLLGSSEIPEDLQ
jgi:purine-binding chemotaxis protein CheW